MRLHDPGELARLMAKADLTGGQLARKVGCSRQFINKLVTGKAAGCRPEIAIGIEAALSVRTGHLFVRNDEPVRRGRGAPQAQPEAAVA